MASLALFFHMESEPTSSNQGRPKQLSTLWPETSGPAQYLETWPTDLHQFASCFVLAISGPLKWDLILWKPNGLLMFRGKNDTCMKTLGWNKKKHDTLPETNSLPLKIGRDPNGNQNSNHPFAGAMLVSGRVQICNMEFHARVFGRVRKFAVLQFVPVAVKKNYTSLVIGFHFL